MADLALKRRLLYARKTARKLCESLGYQIINCDDPVFSFIAIKAGAHQIKVRITINKISEEERRLIKAHHCLHNETKEIWLKVKRGFIREIYNYNNLCVVSKTGEYS